MKSDADALMQQSQEGVERPREGATPTSSGCGRQADDQEFEQSLQRAAAPAL
jgi:hypothetical protein